MTASDPDYLVAWLKRYQSADMAPPRLREPAAAAQRLASLADAADRVLPFGAEPSGFFLAQQRLIRRGDTP